MRSSVVTSRLIPRLDTERLRLRPFDKSDVPRLSQLASDRDVSRMTRTIPHPYPEEAASNWLDHTAGLIERKLLRQYAVVLKADGLLIGNLTLRKRSNMEAEAELAYWLGKAYWGRGFIIEAAQAALSEAAETFGLTTARAAALSVNWRSIRVLEKLGFHQRDTIQVDGHGWDGSVELARYELQLA